MAALAEVEELLRAFRHRDAAALEALASLGIGLESRDSDGCTVLMRAAEIGEPRTMQWILEAGARLDAVSAWGGVAGRDALMIAAARGQGAIVDLLLAAGASAMAMDARGRRAVDLAAAAGHQEIVTRLQEMPGSPSVLSPDASTPDASAIHAGSEDDGLTSVAAERGLGRFDGDDVCLLMRAAPGEVAAWWHEQSRAEVWRRDAYGEEVEVQGPCYLVFRFRGHGWTVVRAVHEGPDSVLTDGLAEGLSEAHAVQWSERLGGDSLFLSHRSDARSMIFRHYQRGRCQAAETWPPTARSSRPWRDRFDDSFADRFEDPDDDLAGWARAQRRVDDHLRRLDAYVPPWGRVRDSVQRLEIAGLSPSAFERMDFLALRRPGATRPVTDL